MLAGDWLTAIDVTVNIIQSLEVVVSLGCDRVLTSGGEATALEGTATIRKMIEQTAGRLTVVPGYNNNNNNNNNLACIAPVYQRLQRQTVSHKGKKGKGRILL